MKSDEYSMLVCGLTNATSKRERYILKKWTRKGWLLDGEFTDEFYRIQDLVLNKEHHLQRLEKHVVNICFLNGYLISGILQGIDIYQDKFSLFTIRSIYKDKHIFNLDEIVFAEQYPNPHKLWRKLNYHYWKRHGKADFFHSRSILYGWTNMLLNTSSIGSCSSYCQCKQL